MHDKTKTNLILIDAFSLVLIVNGLTSSSFMFSLISIILGWAITIGVITFLASKKSLTTDFLLLKIPETSINLFVASIGHLSTGNETTGLKFFFWSLVAILLWIMALTFKDLFRD